MSQPVRVSLTSFADYVNVAGTKRSTIIGQQVDRYRDPGRPAWWAYLAAERGCLAALAAPDPRPVLDRMVAGAPPNMARHYPQLRDGLLAMIRKEKPVGVVRAGAAVWSRGDLAIKVNHTVGLRLADGRLVLALLYFKEPRLGPAGVRPTLRVMEHEVETMLPGATPVVLDVRRGRLISMPKRTDRARLDGLMAGETAGYLAHWQAVAA